jgi:peptidoglycan/xylan/chitin deacetylase (PgdA/CDA1 family)
MAITTITPEMAQSDFITAINNNLTFLQYNGATVTTFSSSSGGITELNSSLVSIKNKTPLTSSVNTLAIGMSGANFINYINQSCVNLNNSFNVKVNRPLLTLRFDDGYSGYHIMDEWLPLLNSLGVVGNLVILAGEVGVAGDFITWANVQTLVSAGWEILSHGMYRNDNYAGLTDAQLLTLLQTTKSTIEAQGITCNNYGAHLAGNCQDVRLPQIARKVYKISSSDLHYEANPVNINLFNAIQLMGDSSISGYPNYYAINTPEEVTYIKSLLDLCKAENRWLTYTLHGYSTTYVANYTEIINYAKSLNIDIVTTEEVYNSLVEY